MINYYLLLYMYIKIYNLYKKRKISKDYKKFKKQGKKASTKNKKGQE